MDSLKKTVTLIAMVEGEKLLQQKITVFTDTVDLKDIGNFLVDIGHALQKKE
jgi:hypothetical protein